ncbi:hypothetical protein Tco_1154314, partial [Tanacetum coccineum]
VQRLVVNRDPKFISFVKVFHRKYKRINPPKYLQILGAVSNHEVEEVRLLSVSAAKQMYLLRHIKERRQLLVKVEQMPPAITSFYTHFVAEVEATEPEAAVDKVE